MILFSFNLFYFYFSNVILGGCSEDEGVKGGFNVFGRDKWRND